MKKGRRMLLALALVVGLLWLCPGEARAAYTNGFSEDGSFEAATYRNGYYEISNAGQLYWFAQQVNGGRTSINGRLTADIVVNTGELRYASTESESTTYRLWDMIGRNDQIYSGIFDGNDHSISGLYYFCKDYTQIQERGSYGAMFYSVSGQIRDMTIENSFFFHSGAVGGLCYQNSGLIENCSVTAYVRTENSTAGGIANRNKGTGQIRNCTSDGSVSSTQNTNRTTAAGGTCYENDGMISGCTNRASVHNGGGVCGANRGTVENCRNTGEVYGSDKDIGGICGGNSGIVSNCSNEGGLSAYFENWSSGGGICGTNDGTVSDCVNKAKITGQLFTTYLHSSVGGICGTNRGVVERCANLAEVHAEAENMGGICGRSDGDQLGVSRIQDCYNIADVFCINSKEACGGGICGYNTAWIISCFTKGQVYSGENIGYFCGYNGTHSVGNGNGGTLYTTYGKIRSSMSYYGYGYYDYWIGGTDIGTSASIYTLDTFDGWAAYYLNGNRQGEQSLWRQNLDNGEKQDELPVLDSTHGIVYQYQGSYYSNYPPENHRHNKTQKTEARLPTCTSDGRTEGIQCLLCREWLQVSTTIPALGHVEGGWIIDKAATETEEGSRHTACTVCGKTLQTEVIPVLTASCGEGLVWSLSEDGVLIISGSGIVTAAPWQSSGITITRVILEEGVQAVHANIFANLTSLVDVSIPLSLTSVGTSAFSGCTALAQVWYGGTQADWAEIAIGGDNAALLKAVRLDIHRHALTEIPGQAATCTEAGYAASWRCICGGLWADADGLRPISQAVVIPAAGHTMGQWIVDQEATATDEGSRHANCTVCGKLVKTEVLPAKGTQIASGSNWTLDQNGLLTISDYNIGNYAMGSAPWYPYREQILRVEFEKDISSVGNYAFYNCPNLKTVDLGDSCYEVGNRAFALCTSLEKVFLGSSSSTSMTVGEYAFYGCTSLHTVSFANTSVTVGISAFESCSALKSIYASSRNYGTWMKASYHAFYRVSAVVYYPVGIRQPDVTGNHSGTLTYEQRASGTCSLDCTWSYDAATKSLTIEGTGVPHQYFSGSEVPWSGVNGEITTVVVKKGITELPSYTFEYQENLTSVSLPNTLHTIAYNTFIDCGELNNLLLPASLTGFSKCGNFVRCESLTDLYFVGTEDAWNAMNPPTNVKAHCLVLQEQTATCTEDGYEAYYYFAEPSVYSMLFDLERKPLQKPAAVSKFGHLWEQGHCRRCGETTTVLNVENNSVHVELFSLQTTDRIMVACYDADMRLLCSFLPERDSAETWLWTQPVPEETAFVKVFVLGENWEPIRPAVSWEKYGWDKLV